MLLLLGDVKVDEATFPDAVFREYLKAITIRIKMVTYPKRKLRQLVKLNWEQQCYQFKRY